MNRWLLAARPKTLIAAIAPVWVAGGLAFHYNTFKWAPQLICLIFGCLIQILTNFANDYYDYTQGIDTPERIGPKRMVATGRIQPRVMVRALYSTTFLTFLMGASLLVYGSLWLLPIGILALFFAYAYTAAPFSLGYKGWGDLLVIIFFGFVAVGCTFYIQSDFWCWEIIWLSLAVGLLSNNILLVNNYRDYTTDLRAGKQTSIVRFGTAFGRRYYKINSFLSLMLPILFKLNGYSFYILLPWCTLPLCIKNIHMLEQATTEKQFERLLTNTALFFALYSCTFGIVLALN